MEKACYGVRSHEYGRMGLNFRVEGIDGTRAYTRFREKNRAEGVKGE